MSINVSMIETNGVSTDSSPTNRAKFLCSHGGKILPSLTDGKLKYIGGETRIISIPHDISFQEVMKKLTYQIDGEMILKYQAVCEDLDMLVTVRCDEDVGHMVNEIERYHHDQKLKAFLFPASNLIVSDYPDQHHYHHQRYIDAINGVIRTSSFNNSKTHLKKGSFDSSSACSSPNSPEIPDSACMAEPSIRNTRFGVHRVHSSPNLYGNGGVHSVQQQLPSNYGYRQSHVSSCRPPVDIQKSLVPEKLISVRSVGRSDGVIRYQRYTMVPNYYNLVPRHHHNSTSDKRFINRNRNPATNPFLDSPR